MRRRNIWARTVPASQTFCSASIWTNPPRNWTGRSKKYSATLLRCLSHWLRRQRSSKRSGKSTMNTSVNIGSTQDFRLSRALLVYGKSSYDAFPYRHPFIVVHEVIHDDDGARLAEGQLVNMGTVVFQQRVPPLNSLGFCRGKREEAQAPVDRISLVDRKIN